MDQTSVTEREQRKKSAKHDERSSALKMSIVRRICISHG